MPRLKVYRAHLGFYDTIVAATSQKEAAEVWGANPREFASGFASVTTDETAKQAALAKPGVVLKRPFGSRGAFKAEAELPKAPKLSARQKRARQSAKRAEARKAQQKKRAARKARKKEAEHELRSIEREEARLRARRRALQKKFRLHSVK